MIAESYERIHRSNLVGMGIIPCQYLEGQDATSLGLTGKESYTIEIPSDIQPGQVTNVKVCTYRPRTSILEDIILEKRPFCVVTFFTTDNSFTITKFYVNSPIFWGFFNTQNQLPYCKDR